MEVTIVLPILLLLLAATAEFGRYFYVYATLSNATHTAVRYVASHTFTSPSQQDNAEAINLALCGRGADCNDGSQILPGLTAEHFEILTQGGTAYFPTTVTVRIHYTYTPLFGLEKMIPGMSWARVPVKPSTTMRFTLSN